MYDAIYVSTHSRPKAAACRPARCVRGFAGFNTQPPEGGCTLHATNQRGMIRFNTQPPEGGCIRVPKIGDFTKSFNTQPPEGGCLSRWWAACGTSGQVSTHSRPKAAARSVRLRPLPADRFNTQPPEGGCCRCCVRRSCRRCFNTQPPEGGCRKRRMPCPRAVCFNTQPPEGGCRFGWRCCRCR